MIISFGDIDIVKQNPYKTARISSFLPAEIYKMGSNWYGGNAKFVARTIENLLLIVDKDLNTIDVAVEEKDIKLLPPEYIDILVKHRKIEPSKKTKKGVEQDGL